MAGEISTPTTSVKIENFTPTQLDFFKSSLKLYGQDVFASVKTSGDHLVNIQTLNDGLIYIVNNDGSITGSDTISDIDGNTFAITFKGTYYIPALWRCRIEIDGTDAIVSLDINTDINLAENVISGTFINKFGTTGTGDGQFNNPHGVSACNSKIYVVDYTNENVQIFDLNGNFISKFGTAGTGDGQFDLPFGVFATTANIYVADSNNDRIQIFDLSGTFVSKFGTAGTGDGQFDEPRGVAVNSTQIFVTDHNNDRIQIFDLSGTFVSEFGSSGTGDGQFDTPSGIAVTATNMYIVGTANDRVQIFI